jgi:5-methylphenazine-1-carboxylate 1-monooxygenase
MKAIIIGAGIGGLTAALSLHAAGIDVEVFETVRDIKPLGQGINLQPNGVREFTELGLAEGLAATAIETSTLSYYNKLGQLIWSEPRGLRAGYKWPQYSIHRGDLQAVLLAALRERTGEGSLPSVSISIPSIRTRRRCARISSTEKTRSRPEPSKETS